MRLRRRHVVLGLLGVLVAGAVVAFANSLTVTSGHLGAKSTATSLTTTTAANLTPNYLVTAPATATAGTVFNVTLQARLGTTNDPSVTGIQCVTFSGPGNSPAPSNTAPSYPGPGLCAVGQSSVTFTLGSATAAVTLFRAEAGVTLTATSTLRSGISGSIAVDSKGVALAFSMSCPVTNFPKNGSQTYSINVPLDAYSNPFTSNAGLAVNLALSNSSNYSFQPGGAGTTTVTITSGPASNSFTIVESGNNKTTNLSATLASGTGFTAPSTCTITST